MANSTNFNLTHVHEAFLNALVENDDVAMDSYLIAYKELFKFFQLMGSVFSFVASDVKEKIGILEDFRKKDKNDNFHTFKKMVDFEKENSLLHSEGYVSGSRTLLRLHRGLDFIREFLKGIGELQETDKTSAICQKAYNNTLAKHHPWVIRKSAVVAMYALPTRKALLLKVCGDENEVKKATEVLPAMLEVTADAYNRTEKLFTEHNLHDLP
ncbi:ceramide-1-phosphate transfer protein [Bacillus rossius redtenbacheri]|uniref:ceramide-1-phosphate transfer protein n=1 Tax=Bacillus rossius redtenbacheri TaxID=93214 RepID=UPI002FDEA820